MPYTDLAKKQASQKRWRRAHKGYDRERQAIYRAGYKWLRIWRKAFLPPKRKAGGPWMLDGTQTPEELTRLQNARQAGMSLTLPQLRRLREEHTVCAACGNGVARGQEKLGLDHDHDTGHVRALLCAPCNSAYGFMEENLNRILMLARYAFYVDNLNGPEIVPAFKPPTPEELRRII